MSFSEQVDLGVDIPERLTVAPFFPDDRLLHLHPNWFILRFSREGRDFSARVKDYATEEELTISGSFEFDSDGGRLIDIRLEEGNRLHIVFFSDRGRLQVRVESEETVEPDNPNLLWIKAIREYLRLNLKRSPFALFWRFVMNRVILTMNPSQRKICLMIARFTMLELLVIVLIVVGYFIFVL
ncbi:MAG: hypothetical protein MI863_12700 [Desulfobacterales bacterium]|nr:hypothetical protein [Desulfobacterales bacterium]